MSVLVRIAGAATGIPTPHDGRYVVSWSPHTRFGYLDLETTDRPSRARRFDDAAEALKEWRMVSRVEPKRPTDGRPNRPLTAYTVEFRRATGSTQDTGKPQ